MATLIAMNLLPRNARPVALIPSAASQSEGA